VMDATKRPLSTYQLLDMSKDDAEKQKLIDEGKVRFNEIDKIEIAQDLEPGTYDVDVATIRDEYLFKKEKKGWLSKLLRR